MRDNGDDKMAYLFGLVLLSIIWFAFMMDELGKLRDEIKQLKADLKGKDNENIG